MHKIDDLMQTKMTRKQFLRTLGVGLLALGGLSAMLRALNYQGSSTNQAYGGYGSSSYGGAAVGKLQPSFGKNN